MSGSDSGHFHRDCTRGGFESDSDPLLPARWSMPALSRLDPPCELPAAFLLVLFHIFTVSVPSRKVLRPTSESATK